MSNIKALNTAMKTDAVTETIRLRIDFEHTTHLNDYIKDLQLTLKLSNVEATHIVNDAFINARNSAKNYTNDMPLNDWIESHIRKTAESHFKGAHHETVLLEIADHKRETLYNEIDHAINALKRQGLTNAQAVGKLTRFFKDVNKVDLEDDQALEQIKDELDNILHPKAKVLPINKNKATLPAQGLTPEN